MFLFFFNAPATTEIYTLSLHDALPISNRIICEAGRETMARLGPLGNRAESQPGPDRKSTRLNSSHANISYAVFCLKKKKNGHDGDGHPLRSIYQRCLQDSRSTIDHARP